MDDSRGLPLNGVQGGFSSGVNLGTACSAGQRRTVTESLRLSAKARNHPALGPRDAPDLANVFRLSIFSGLARDFGKYAAHREGLSTFL